MIKKNNVLIVPNGCNTLDKQHGRPKLTTLLLIMTLWKSGPKSQVSVEEYPLVEFPKHTDLGRKECRFMWSVF